MRGWITAVLALAAAPGLAQAPACPAPAAPPPELAGWSRREAVAAARATLTVGRAADLALRPTARAGWRVPPEKPGAADSFGGVATFAVARAGTYRVALDAGAWIDVLENGRPVASGAHGHGPACSGVAKMVDFTLRPGRHVLQVAGNKEAQIAVMVVPIG